MPHMPPELVTSPKQRIKIVEILRDGKGTWSAARAKWDGEPRIAIRWDGNEESPKGNPQSRGVPTWFILPDELESVVEKRIEELNATKA